MKQIKRKWNIRNRKTFEWRNMANFCSNTVGNQASSDIRLDKILRKKPNIMQVQTVELTKTEVEYAKSQNCWITYKGNV